MSVLTCAGGALTQPPGPGHRQGPRAVTCSEGIFHYAQENTHKSCLVLELDAQASLAKVLGPLELLVGHRFCIGEMRKLDWIIIQGQPWFHYSTFIGRWDPRL